ncbi:hemicentin-1-like [Mizuhopecten yessoensis]|uniref:hemicentin-1-like n=1 Tax=Mizuhopecten yessoensis TaxID=6573 RepID=UPI000B45ED66|nr:hemicentin-1-like [Mizuhopecten yessoensis]XP_021370013.1 hemicentin-1-like [Mizuhopecten yessoensis]XP_021370014.1 hemicentin-1-like [Mizuhopecten yessoensis]
MEMTVHNVLLSAILLVSAIGSVTSISAPGTPQITNFPNTAIQGDVLTVTCKSTGGDPDPQLWWYQGSAQKDNTYIVQVTGSTRITENNYTFSVMRSHENEDFSCTARNTQDTRTTTVTFASVYATPGNPVLTGPTTFSMGTSQTWNCKTYGGYPLPTISWYLGDQIITGDWTNVTSSNSTYDVESQSTRTVLAADNGKQIQCRVNHQQTLATPKVTSKTLTVYSPPTVSITPDLSNVLTGNDLSLTCSVTSSLSSYTVAWYKVGSAVALTSSTDHTINGRVLTILSAASGDAGNYYCTATNSAGTSANSNNVEVVLYTIPTNAVSSPSSVTTQAGQSFTLTCSASASPSSSISYSWSFGGSVLSTTPSLNVPNAQKGNSGTYVCDATNAYGTTSTDVAVDIQYAPQSAVSQPSVSAAIGTSVSLSCDTDANPAATSYVWFDGSTQLAVTEKINSVEAGSAVKTYTCRATNDVGQSGDIVFTVTGTSTGGGGEPDTGASTGDTGTSLSTGVIVAIVLGIAFLLLIIIIIIVCCICSGSCKKKEKKKKKKSQITPKPEPEVYETRTEQPIYHVETYTPRHKPRPYSEFNPSIVSRKHVDVDMESSDGHGGYGYIYGNNYQAETQRSTTSRFVVRAPPSAVESENGTIISVYDDSRHLTSKRVKHPVHLSGEHTYNTENTHREARRHRRHKKKHHHKREAGEGEESPPRKERRERAESEHRDGSRRKKEKRDRSKHRRSRSERRGESEDLREHGYISDGSPAYSQDNLVTTN